MDNLLIVFVKHPELGKVKTRLAASIGEEKALSVYKQLLEHTLSICNSVNTDVHIYYTEEVIDNDIWNNFKKFSQLGLDLGLRMFNAFEENKQYHKKVIIGSDCLEINKEHILEAFRILDKKDYVLGPANDGGYYLLGMKENKQELFSKIKWSTNSVLDQTILQINKLNKTYSLLNTLIDIDTEEDLIKHKNYEQILLRNN